MSWMALTARRAGFVLASILLLSGFVQAANRALVIGNNSYGSANWPSLQNAVNDAVDMAAMLTDLGFEVMLRTDLSRSELEQAVDSFIASIGTDDTVLFFYAGHGGALGSMSAEPLLIPTDARGVGDAAELRDESYPLSRLLNRLNSSPALLKMLFLDMCREELDTMLGARAAGDQPLGPGTVRSFVPSQAANFTDTRARGTVVSYSTSAGHIAYDRAPNGRNGVYTAALLEALGQENLTLDQTFRYMRERVTGITSSGTYPYLRGTQLPTEENFLFGQDFYFKAHLPAPAPVQDVIWPGQEEELLRRAQEGGVIRLAPGEHRLDRTLELSGDVALIAEDSSRTAIVSSQEGSVVHYHGGGTLRVQGISLVHEGDSWAHVLRVDGGNVEIDDSHFTGGVWDGVGLLGGGSGLFLTGDAGGTVQNSRFEGNSLHGIEVEGRAAPVLRGNTLSTNQGSGITFSGEATGTAEGNTVEHNADNGISVLGSAAPSLIGNRLSDNEANGILFSWDASGSATGNTSERNSSGISVAGRAKPELRENVLSGNHINGLTYDESGGGTATGNRIENNGIDGIDVFGQAEPTLDGNDVIGNEEAGILFTDDAGGTVSGNRIEGNGTGVAVLRAAAPRLIGNTVSNSEQSGFYYAGNSRGTARDNTTRENGLNGFELAGRAMPLLAGNTIIDNDANGIVYSHDSRGIADANVIEGNYNGILLLERASPLLRNNRLRGNDREGILYAGQAKGTALRNVIEENSSGIVLTGNAAPDLRENTLSNNEESGIYFLDDAGGTVEANSATGNRHGFNIQGRATPTLLGNEAHGNSMAGILYMGEAGGSARGNNSYGNGFDGIAVVGQAAPELIENVLNDNELRGIYFAGNARGSARGNSGSGNGTHGILVEEEAVPDLQGNTINDEVATGID